MLSTPDIVKHRLHVCCGRGPGPGEGDVNPPEVVCAHDGPPVDRQGHLQEQQREEAPVEEEGVDLTQNRMVMVGSAS